MSSSNKNNPTDDAILSTIEENPQQQKHPQERIHTHEKKKTKIKSLFNCFSKKSSCKPQRESGTATTTTTFSKSRMITTTTPSASAVTTITASCLNLKRKTKLITSSSCSVSRGNSTSATACEAEDDLQTNASFPPSPHLDDVDEVEEEEEEEEIEELPPTPSNPTLKIISMLYNEGIRHVSRGRFEPALRCFDNALSVLSPSKSSSSSSFSLSITSPMFVWMVQTKYQIVRMCFALHRSTTTTHNNITYASLQQSLPFKQPNNNNNNNDEDDDDDEESSSVSSASTSSYNPQASSSTLFTSLSTTTESTLPIANNKHTLSYIKRAKSNLEEIAFILPQVALSPDVIPKSFLSTSSTVSVSSSSSSCSTNNESVQEQQLYMTQDIVSTLHVWGEQRDALANQESSHLNTPKVSKQKHQHDKNKAEQWRNEAIQFYRAALYIIACTLPLCLEEQELKKELQPQQQPAQLSTSSSSSSSSSQGYEIHYLSTKPSKEEEQCEKVLQKERVLSPSSSSSSSQRLASPSSSSSDYFSATSNLSTSPTPSNEAEEEEEEKDDENNPNQTKLQTLALMTARLYYDLAVSLLRFGTVSSKEEHSSPPTNTQENKHEKTIKKEQEKEALSSLAKSLSLQKNYGTVFRYIHHHSKQTQSAPQSKKGIEYTEGYMLLQTLDLLCMMHIHSNHVDEAVVCHEEYALVLQTLSDYYYHHHHHHHPCQEDNKMVKEEIMQDRKKKKEEEDERLARVLSTLGQLYAARKDYSKALAKLQQAMCVLGDDYEDIVHFTNTPSSSPSPQFSSSSLVPIILPITNKNKLRISLLRHASEYYLQMQDYRSSLSMRSNILVLQRQLFGLHHPNVAVTLRGMARVHLMVGRCQKALDCREEEKKVWKVIVDVLVKQQKEKEEEDGGDKNGENKTAKMNLGTVSLKEAREALQRVLFDLGSLYENAMGEYNKAVECYNEALTVQMCMLDELNQDKRRKMKKLEHISLAEMERQKNDLTCKIQDTRRKIGGVYYKKGEFSMALMTSFREDEDEENGVL